MNRLVVVTPLDEKMCKEKFPEWEKIGDHQEWEKKDWGIDSAYVKACQYAKRKWKKEDGITIKSVVVDNAIDEFTFITDDDISINTENPQVENSYIFDKNKLIEATHHLITDGYINLAEKGYWGVETLKIDGMDHYFYRFI